MWRTTRTTPVEVLLVRAVTALACLLLSANPLTPIYLYCRGWIPFRVESVAIVIGCMFIMAIPIASPQYAQPQVTKEDTRRLEESDKDLYQALERTREMVSQMNLTMQTHIQTQALRNNRTQEQLDENRTSIRTNTAMFTEALDGIQQGQATGNWITVVMASLLALVLKFAAFWRFVKRAIDVLGAGSGVLLMAAHAMRHRFFG